VDISILFADKLVKRGYKIDWLLQSESECHSDYETDWAGGKAYIGATDNGASFLRRLKKNFLNIIHDIKALRLSSQKRYDIVIVRDKFLAALFAIFAQKLNGTKFIFWLSYPFPESDFYEIKDKTARYPMLYYIRGHFRKIILYKIIFPLVEHVFVQTSFMKKFIVEKYDKPSEIMTPVPMGINLEQIPFFGYQNNTDKGAKKTIVYLGTLLKTRKLDFLIRAFKIVKKHVPDAELVLVGGGEDKSDEDLLVRQIDKCGLCGSVKITGMLPQTDAWQYIKNALVCVSPICPSPILDCGSPTKLIEYMAMGKAVVANDHPEQKELIEESSGGIIVPWKEKEFADAIVRLINDIESCRKYGFQGYEYIIKHRSYDTLANIVDNKLVLINNRN
jgi:glycosyltransferase involved in cell wall biosynthesis